MIRRKIPWTSQPQSPVEIDRSKIPFRLSALVLGSCPINLATGASFALNAVVPSIASVGRILRAPGPRAQTSGFITLDRNPPTGGLTVIAIASRRTSYSANSVDFLASTTNPSLIPGFSIDLSNSWDTGHENKLRGFGSLYLDGVLQATGRSDAALNNGQFYNIVCRTSTYTAGDALDFMGAYTNAYWTSEIDCALFCVIEGDIGDNLAREISRNPWLLFAPQERRVFVSVAGGGLNITTILATADASGFTANVDRQLAITASLGTATASGFTANIDRQLAISATLATASADAFSANADRQLSIIATLATATASGFTANVSSDLNVTTTLATATASGFSANVDRQLSIVTILATATASGFDASIALGGGLNITATHAVATASGFDASITISTPQGSGWETYVAPIRKKTVKQFKEEFNNLTYFELEEKEDEVKSEIRLVEQDIRLNEDLGLDNLILKLKLALKIQKAKLQAIKSVKQEKIQEAQVQQIQYEAIPIEYTQDIDIIHEDENIDADLSYIAAILRMKYFN